MADTDGQTGGGNGSSNSIASGGMFGAGSAAPAAAAAASVLRFNVAGSAGDLAGLAMGSRRGLPKYSSMGKGVLNPVLLDMGTMSKR
jgi:hypothetical protein